VKVKAKALGLAVRLYNIPHRLVLEEIGRGIGAGIYVEHDVGVAVEEEAVGLGRHWHHLEVLDPPDEQTKVLASLVPLD
jgi:hypothetical protein